MLFGIIISSPRNAQDNFPHDALDIGTNMATSSSQRPRPSGSSFAPPPPKSSGVVAIGGRVYYDDEDDDSDYVPDLELLDQADRENQKLFGNEDLGRYRLRKDGGGAAAASAKKSEQLDSVPTVGARIAAVWAEMVDADAAEEKRLREPFRGKVFSAWCFSADAGSAKTVGKVISAPTIKRNAQSTVSRPSKQVRRPLSEAKREVVRKALGKVRGHLAGGAGGAESGGKNVFLEEPPGKSPRAGALLRQYNETEEASLRKFLAPIMGAAGEAELPSGVVVGKRKREASAVVVRRKIAAEIPEYEPPLLRSVRSIAQLSLPASSKKLSPPSRAISKQYKQDLRFFVEQGLRDVDQQALTISGGASSSRAAAGAPTPIDKRAVVPTVLRDSLLQKLREMPERVRGGVQANQNADPNFSGARMKAQVALSRLETFDRALDRDAARKFAVMQTHVDNAALSAAQRAALRAREEEQEDHDMEGEQPSAVAKAGPSGKSREAIAEENLSDSESSLPEPDVVGDAGVLPGGASAKGTIVHDESAPGDPARLDSEPLFQGLSCSTNFQDPHELAWSIYTELLDFCGFGCQIVDEDSSDSEQESPPRPQTGGPGTLGAPSAGGPAQQPAQEWPLPKTVPKAPVPKSPRAKSPRSSKSPPFVQHPPPVDDSSSPPPPSLEQSLARLLKSHELSALQPLDTLDLLSALATTREIHEAHRGPPLPWPDLLVALEKYLKFHKLPFRSWKKLSAHDKFAKTPGLKELAKFNKSKGKHAKPETLSIINRSQADWAAFTEQHGLAEVFEKKRQTGFLEEQNFLAKMGGGGVLGRGSRAAGKANNVRFEKE